MSVISISSGSCGASLSSAVFECINQSIIDISSKNDDNRDYSSSMQEIYFKADKKGNFSSRSILIGSETSNFNEYKQVQRQFKSKDVIKSENFLKHDLDWNQDPNLVVEYQENSNNCWAKGYYQSQQHEELIRDYITKAAEDADTLDSFIIYAGFAGGTGSGGCSLISQVLSDDYPSTCQTCVGVLPYISGENAMQSINTMLALTTIYDTSNGIILFENDRYDSICKNIFKDRGFCPINDCIASSLFSNIQPIAETCSISRKTLYRNNVEMMLRDLCSYPKHKILTSRALPVGSRKNLSYEDPTHSKLLSQIVESINESLLPFETTETNDVDVDVHFSTFTPTAIQQGNVLKMVGNKKSVYNKEEENFMYKNVRDVPIIAPDCFTVKNSLLVNKKKSLDLPNKSKTIGAKNVINGNVRLINTGGIRKKPVKKNVVTSMNINIGGILDEEGIDFTQHLSQVIFGGHGITPAKASYSPWDGGIGNKSCAILSNCQTPLKAITRSNDSLKMTYASNAYINKYKSFGMDEDEFTEAIIRGEQIVKSYNL